MSYLRGRDEAEAIAREIDARFGPGRCRIFRYDTGEDPAPQLAAIEGPITHAYYFATGRIFAPASAAVFDPAKFAAFADVYVTAFHRLAEHLLALSPGRPAHSSTRPRSRWRSGPRASPNTRWPRRPAKFSAPTSRSRTGA